LRSYRPIVTSSGISECIYRKSRSMGKYASDRTACRINKSISAIERILGEDSELREMWEEDGEENQPWRAAMADLRSRIVCDRV
jgi:hypothetical protein